MPTPPVETSMGDGNDGVLVSNMKAGLGSDTNVRSDPGVTVNETVIRALGFRHSQGVISEDRQVVEAAPGAALVIKAVVFTLRKLYFPNYIVLIEPHGNCIVWVTDKTPEGFNLNYSVAGGVEVAWEII